MVSFGWTKLFGNVCQSWLYRLVGVVAKPPNCQKVQMFEVLVLSRLESFFGSVFFVGKVKVQIKRFCVALVAWRAGLCMSRKVY